MSEPRSLFAVGDRVLIVGAHPWNGHVGEIADPWPTRDLDWVIELDDGQRIGASEAYHLEKAVHSSASRRAGLPMVVVESLRLAERIEQKYPEPLEREEAQDALVQLARFVREELTDD